LEKTEEEVNLFLAREQHHKDYFGKNRSYFEFHIESTKLKLGKKFIGYSTLLKKVLVWKNIISWLF